MFEVHELVLGCIGDENSVQMQSQSLVVGSGRIFFLVMDLAALCRISGLNKNSVLAYSRFESVAAGALFL
jgi:hypothetical protein